MGGGLTFAGVDQGIDFTGAGPVFSPVAGVVTKVERGGSGWPGEGALLIERLSNGAYMYVAEDFAPAVRVGAREATGAVLGRATGSGQAPGIEIGYADAAGRPLAPLYPNPHSPKAAGERFREWILSLSGGGGGSSSGGVLA